MPARCWYDLSFGHPQLVPGIQETRMQVTASLSFASGRSGILTRMAWETLQNKEQRNLTDGEGIIHLTVTGFS